MNTPKDEPKKVSPLPTAILAGIIAGLAAGYVSYLLGGITAFLIGFIVGGLIGSRTVLAIRKARDQQQ